MPGHRSGTYLNALLRSQLVALPPKQWPASVTARVLTTPEAESLQAALLEDARDYYFSAVLSFAEALRGPPQKLYSWATVKLYYSVFYAFRSILGAHGWCVFYVPRPDNKTSCYSIEAIAGANAKTGEQSTHKAVLKCFGEHLQHLGLLAPIGIDVKAPDWLMHRREEVNYKNARFCEPLPPPHFEAVSQRGMRELVAVYLDPKNRHLAFDPDHAIIAFPLAALRRARQDLGARNVDVIRTQEVEALRPHFADRAGPLGSLLGALTRVSPFFGDEEGHSSEPHRT